jgi:RNA methyltransferase, TrmH family
MKYRRITSTSNPLIKGTLSILKKHRRERPAMVLIEGVHLIEAALTAGARMDSVFFTASLADGEEGRKMLEALPRKGDSFFEVSDKVMDRLSDTESPQGIVAVVSYQPLLLQEVSTSAPPLVAVLDGVQDPGNVGTIIRTSDAAGADTVVLLPGTCDPFMPKPLRASAGSVFSIPVVETELAPFMKWMKDRSMKLVVTAADATDTLYDTDLARPLAFAFGNEARGVSGELREAADLALRIPIYGRAESLNVGSAAAICLYEAVRQRRNR